MENRDIRWKQRLNNFIIAFSQLDTFLQAENLNDMEEQGLIKAFEYTYELAWKTLQDLLKEKGYIGIVEPRPVIEQAFQDGYILDGKGWMRMQKSRNMTSRTYDRQTAKEIIKSIRTEYFKLFGDVLNKLKQESIEK